jgi:hypothetical protein
MENAHERRWPTGLSSLEIRQLNRRQYENYICRRIPGKQAVAGNLKTRFSPAPQCGIDDQFEIFFYFSLVLYSHGV